MAKFKEGDIVYHKATGQRGVIVEPPKRIPGATYGEEQVGGWIIAWKDKSKTFHRETELLTEEEHKKKEPGAAIASAEF